MKNTDTAVPGEFPRPKAEGEPAPTSPCLPGLEPPAGDEPPPVPKPIAREATPVTAHVPPPPRGSRLASMKMTISGLAGITVVAAVATLVGVAAYRFVSPRTVVQEVVRELPDGIPLALLPDAADPALWPMVSNMSGSIDGVILKFKHGMASVGGAEYKVCLDFCRSGAYVYVRVAGPKRVWVARLDEQGHITRCYPAPKASKPLKSIFGP